MQVTRFVSLMWLLLYQKFEDLNSVFNKRILIIGNSLCEPLELERLISRASVIARATVNWARARSQVILVADRSERNPRRRHPTSAGLPAAQAIFPASQLRPSLSTKTRTYLQRRCRPLATAPRTRLPTVVCASHPAFRLVIRATHINRHRRLFTGLRVQYCCGAGILNIAQGNIGACRDGPRQLNRACESSLFEPQTSGGVVCGSV